MARKLVVEIIGDASSLTKSYKQATYSTKAFGAEVDKATRGVLSGSGALRGFGRSLAFASGGFLAFEGVTSFLEGSVTAARDAAVSQRALAAQMKTSGESFAANRDQIEKAGLSLSRFGFTSEDADQALVVLDRGTGSLHKSIGLLGLTADLARAKNLSFADSANIVAKVFGGQTTALRRAVPGLDKNAKGWDLIREAQAKLAGQAAAGTTVNERFSATLHETQRIIGEGLLPVLNQYLGQLTTWLDKMNRSGQLQKDVNKFVKDATPIFHDAGVAIGGAAEALGRYQGALDGLRKASSGNWLQRSVADTLRLLIDPGYGLGKVLSLFGGKGGGTSGLANLRGPVGTPSQTLPPGLEGAIGTAAPPRRGATVEQRNRWFDAMISRDITRAGYIPTLKGQIAALRTVVGLIQQRIDITKDITRKGNLEDQLLAVQNTIAGDQAQITQNIADKRQRAADAMKAARQAAIDLKQGWLDFAVERAAATKTLKDDVKAQQQIESWLKGRMKHEGRTLELVQGLWEARQKIKDFNKSKADTDPLAGLMQVSSRQLANILAQGTGLDLAGRRRLGFNIAGAEIQPVHVHVHIDRREIASVVTKEQTRTSRRTAQQTSGYRG